MDYNHKLKKLCICIITMNKRLKSKNSQRPLRPPRLDIYCPDKAISVFATIEYLEQRANRADMKKFRSALAQIPNAEPADFDRL
jgi:hypothetical protein